jgi:hypothetical protein
MSEDEGMETYQEVTTNKDKIKTKNTNKCPKEDC